MEVPKDICQGGGTYLATTYPTSSTGWGGGKFLWFLVGFQTLEVVIKKYGWMLCLKSSDGGEKKGGLLIDGGENLRSIESFPACHAQLFESQLVRLASTRRTPPNSRVLTCMARCRLEGG